MSKREKTPVEADNGARGSPLRLLIADDDPLQAALLSAHLARPGRTDVDTVGSGAEALERLAHQPYDAVLTDLNMPEMSGVELVQRIRELDSTLPVIIVTAHATLEHAVDGIRAGATDFLPKPVNVDALQALLERAVRERPIRAELQRAQERRAHAAVHDYLRGGHPRLEAVRRFAEQIARAPDARVLITGETGTGKSLLARAIHDLSDVSGQFVEVNCATLPPQLLESELFGHEKGAFTDAKTLKRGLVELADRGTLFLDEIGTMPLELQAKLLLFIERREIRRVGGTHAIPVRCRLVTATHEDLRARVAERTFRQDLLYRLDVAAVTMPPLREMPEIIPELAAHFAQELSASFLHPLPPIDPSSFALLAGYDWPGNARELRNAVERALIFDTGGPLLVRPPETRPGALAGGVVIEHGLKLEEVERRYLEAELQRGGEDLTRMAARLGISRKTLWEKRRRYGL